MDLLNRDYRKKYGTDDLYYFDVCIYESDLKIGVENSLGESNLSEIEDRAVALVRRLRETLYKADDRIPGFFRSLVPLPYNYEKTGEDFTGVDLSFIYRMMKASDEIGTGPMASVAGGISQMVGEMIGTYTDEYIVENGGDIFISSKKEKNISIYAGNNNAFNKIGLKIKTSDMPTGICTSSGKVGRSLSKGNTDAVTVLGRDAFRADAVATFIGNMIKIPGDIEKAISFAEKNFKIEGIFIIIEEQIGLWGNIEICRM